MIDIQDGYFAHWVVYAVAVSLNCPGQLPGHQKRQFNIGNICTIKPVNGINSFRIATIKPVTCLRTFF